MVTMLHYIISHHTNGSEFKTGSETHTVRHQKHQKKCVAKANKLAHIHTRCIPK